MLDSPPVTHSLSGKIHQKQPRVHQTNEYANLLRHVRGLGLLERRTNFYYVVFAILMLATGACIFGFYAIGNSWFQLLIAAGLGILLTQFAFLAHEAAHHQIFASRTVNNRVARVLANGFVGISYSWWMNKHSRHHTHPNVIGKDPDIETDVIVFQSEHASKVSRLHAIVTKRQGWLFFPLLLLEGINLHIHGFRSVFGKAPVDKRWLEITMLLTRIGVYLFLVFLFLPFGLACAFIGVQMAIFGLYMGASFAPNHKGMPHIPQDSKVDFLQRQVLTSRNIRGGWGILAFMGGLNYQIEHHLFPDMPRTQLKKARAVVKKYCDTHSIPYTETSLFESYGIVIRYLNEVGLAARDPFRCPAVAQWRHR